MSSRALVLDSSAFIMGYNPLSIKEMQFTTPSIREELKAANMISLRFNMACRAEKLKLVSPSTRAIRSVRETAEGTGDIERLSRVDLEVLAVAEDLRQKNYSPIIISDDYSIQNVADQMKLDYSSLSNLGIRRRFQWIKRCPSCHRKYPPSPSIRNCPVCGALLRSRPIKKSS